MILPNSQQLFISKVCLVKWAKIRPKGILLIQRTVVKMVGTLWHEALFQTTVCFLGQVVISGRGLLIFLTVAGHLKSYISIFIIIGFSYALLRFVIHLKLAIFPATPWRVFPLNTPAYISLRDDWLLWFSACAAIGQELREEVLLFDGHSYIKQESTLRPSDYQSSCSTN